MSLPSHQLDAFLAVAQTQSFSKAAKTLHLTQSGLSQKIKLLEETLQVTLFLRLPTGVSLTDPGEKLLRYCQTKNMMESELLEDLGLHSPEDSLGVVRIACYSSIFRSVVIPALSPLLKKYPETTLEFMVAPMEELPKILFRAESDIIILDRRLEKSNVEIKELGIERYVAVKSKTYPDKKIPTYLDNDRDDHATAMFFQGQKGKPLTYKRSFFGDCYGILDGVKAGFGCAVMSQHLLKGKHNLEVIETYKPVDFPVAAHFIRQSFYPKNFTRCLEELVKNCAAYLS
ncbi:MAG: LysR family transcriptional regulator [Pseudobacteriovorax sp.]|nr:LysR family transcriptional regulator [Pseudobacteriovorax sp.]